MGLSRAEQIQLLERRRDLHKEIRQEPGLTKKAKELKAEIEKINKKLAED